MTHVEKIKWFLTKSFGKINGYSENDEKSNNKLKSYLIKQPKRTFIIVMDF